MKFSPVSQGFQLLFSIIAMSRIFNSSLLSLLTKIKCRIFNSPNVRHTSMPGSSRKKRRKIVPSQFTIVWLCYLSSTHKSFLHPQGPLGEEERFSTSVCGVCMSMCVCWGGWGVNCFCLCGNQRSTLGVFLCCYTSFFLFETGSPSEPGVCHFCRLAGQ